MQDGGLIRQQFYHALAVHSMAEQIKGVVRAVVAEKEKLLHMAREGAPTLCMRVYWRPSRSRFYHALACSLSSVRRRTQLACQTVSANMLLC